MRVSLSVDGSVLPCYGLAACPGYTLPLTHRQLEIGTSTARITLGISPDVHEKHSSQEFGLTVGIHLNKPLPPHSQMKAGANQKHHYTLKISTRLGRTRYKEQFMFLYRDDLVDLVGSYQFDDEKTEGLDVFARDLYILGFRCLNTVLKDLVIIPVHTKPEDSDKELDKLYDVFVHVRKKWRTDFFIFIFARCGGPPWTGLIDAMKGVVMGEDGNLTLTLRRGNLLLERVKLNLEIQILRLRVAEMTRGNAVWPKDVRSI
ncbi:PREDICTED: uncharacterized protein LOC107101507 [Cyprinodon variegatus]|uniref:uncharacterized protein LOC107101507 n=1 Tax=Cyprinodon variegatus TaxID=28743 RepID=UPI0007426F26|nr:PREDICTED: uncharacterized protein LOC107101507 [Cyprinodon variegatus]